MKTQQPEIKKGLLLCPDNLSTDYHLLNFIKVEKSPANIKFDTSPCINKDIKNFFADMQPLVQTAIGEFDHGWIDMQLAQVREAVTKSGNNSSAYVQSNMLRYVHGILEKIKPFAPSVKWYHRYQSDGKVKIMPASFSSYRPQLSFKVNKANDFLYIDTQVEVNGANYTLNDFTQNHFLLRSNNEFFVLFFKDYQTLNWLQQVNFAEIGLNKDSFETEIISRLEENYTVDRNNLFTDIVLSPEPVNRIQLSELSGSFLMLTPQWKYDEFLVDGNWQEVYKTTVRGKSYSVNRNKEKEDEFVKFLQSLHPNFANQVSKGYYYISFSDAQKKQWFIKSYHKLLDSNIEIAGLDMLKHFKFSPYKAETEMEVVGRTEQQLSIRMKVSFGSESVPLSELQKTLLAGQHAVLLKDNSLGVLSEEWLRQYGTIIKHGRVSKDIITVASWMGVTENDDPNEQVLQKTVPSEWLTKWKQWQEPHSTIYQLPSMVKATLRPYQHKGFEWMSLLSELGAGACLADDMGLGKTLQTISFICWQTEKINNMPASGAEKKAAVPESKRPLVKSLIICPASLIYNWEAECAKFAPSLQTVVYHGPNRKDSCFTDSSQLVISTYGTIRADFQKIKDIDFTCIVLDESHNIKNPVSQIAQAVTELRAHCRIALSGTPVMNNTFDLYSQFNFTIPGMFGSKEFFKKEYADPIEVYGDEEKLKALNKLTAPFLLRRTKEQVAADLPEKTELVLWCEMSSSQKMQYDEIRDQVKSHLLDNIKKEGLNKSKIFLLQAITKLRQICNSPLLLPANEQTSTDSIKTLMLMDELENNLGGHKSLVFSQFSSMLDLLAAECKKRQIPFYHFDGQTPPARRAEMVDAFQSEEDKTPVFLISLKAGNAGLNLTAADYVFLFDPWWNTAVQQQAINRTHRIGQQKKVFAYQMICKDTIEEKIVSIQKRKQKLSDELLASEDSFLQTLSEEDIMYLFS